MTAGRRQFDELRDILWSIEDGSVADRDIARLDELVRGDERLLRQYIEYARLVSDLRFGATNQRTRETLARAIGLDAGTGDGQLGAGDGRQETDNENFGDLEICRFGDFGIGGSGVGGWDSGFGVGDFRVPNLQISKSPNQQIPPLSTLHSPLSTNFVGGPVFSYIAATLILGVMLLSAWAYTITHDYGASFAINSRGSTTPGEPAQRPELIFVARVTGMKDCRWSDPATETYAGAYVPLDRQYALASGLMEITYLSGAKVILEGPCRYEVESDRGGFLALGKLTARVEKRSEVRGQRPESGGLAASAASMMPQTANLPSPIGRGAGGEGNGNQKQSALTLTLSQRERGQVPSPKTQDLSPKTEISKSPNLQISTFTVRTPTAIVTDLGTEFGVAVAANGDTTSHVFQGSITVRAVEGPAASSPGGLAASAASDADQIALAAGHSARVERNAATGVARITTDEQEVAAPKFVRRIYEPPKQLDLLDIVAGGNGLGNRREQGIDSSTGMMDVQYSGDCRQGNGQYHKISWHRLIDGVFMPDGRSGPVVLDSAGHAFDGFPETTGRTWASIWPRSSEVGPENRSTLWIYDMGKGEKFMPKGRGFLGLPTNTGISFDLKAMRRMYPEVRPARFRATAGMVDLRYKFPDLEGMIDLWVFIDGRLKLKRTGIRPQDPVFPLDVEIAADDRFLTLVSTDGGNGDFCDSGVLGDPVLKMTAIDPEQQTEEQRMNQ